MYMIRSWFDYQLLTYSYFWVECLLNAQCHTVW